MMDPPKLEHEWEKEIVFKNVQKHELRSRIASLKSY